MCPCSSSVDGADSLGTDEDITEDMELEQLQEDSAYDSFSSQGEIITISSAPGKVTFHWTPRVGHLTGITYCDTTVSCRKVTFLTCYVPWLPGNCWLRQYEVPFKS